VSVWIRRREGGCGGGERDTDLNFVEIWGRGGSGRGGGGESEVSGV
jgi:hypothetical protein